MKSPSASIDAGKQFSLPIIGAIAVHIVVFALLLGSWNMTYKEPKKFEIPKNIKAEMVTIEKPKPEPVKPKVVPKQETKAKQVEQPKPKPVTPAKEVAKPVAETKPKEPAPKPVDKAVNVSKEVVKPEPIATPKPAPVVEPEPVPVENLFDDLLAEMAAEDEAIQDKIQEIEDSKARQAKIAAQVSDYITLITQQVEEKWSRPVELRLMDLSNIEAVVAVEILPTGELQSASIVRSSGNVNYDQSVIRAIEKVRRFTVPQDSEVFEAGGFRQLNIIFRPEDLMKP